MKRAKLVKHLQRHQCAPLREGARHTVFRKVGTNRQTAVPRHTEIHANMVRKICKDLDVPIPGEK